MKYVYKILGPDPTVDTLLSLEEQINRKSEEGWELFTVYRDCFIFRKGAMENEMPKV